MDLSRITTLHIDSDSPFTKASPQDRLTLGHTFKNGIVIKPVVQNGRIARHTAHDKSGKELNVFYAKLSPNDRCLICVEDEDRKQSYCVEYECPPEPKK